MEKIVRQSLLFDFYGELLTEHQKSIYSDVICDKILEGYEEKLHLLEKFLSARQGMESIREITQTIKNKNSDPALAGLLDKLEDATENVVSLL